MADGTEIVNLEVLKKYIGEDPEGIVEFLGEFRKSVRLHAAGLERAVTARDIEAVSHLSHTLKSTARAAGATAFGELLADLEGAAKRHEIEAIDRYFEAFTAAVPKVERRLVELLAAR